MVEVVGALHKSWLKEEEVEVLMVLIHLVVEVVEGHIEACRHCLTRI